MDDEDDYYSKECHIGANRIESYITEWLPMDNKDDYFSKECRNEANRIKSYITEWIPPYPPVALPPVELKGFQHLYKSTETMSSWRVIAPHKATIKHGLLHDDHARRRDQKKQKNTWRGVGRFLGGSHDEGWKCTGNETEEESKKRRKRCR
jgi:hypothetical protein